MRNGSWALAVPATVLVMSVWLALACNITPAPSASQSAGATAPATVLAPMASAPTPTAAPPTGTATASATPPSPDALAGPPAGLLSAGGAPVTGAKGSYCWGTTGQTVCTDAAGFSLDSPQISVAQAGQTLTFTLSPTTPFESLTADYVDNGTTIVLGRAGSSFDPDMGGSPPPMTTEAQFPAPPSGDWVLEVFVTFPNGDASYGWHANVR